jgi:ATP-dependent RNA helicase SUPV3L1/SUV3
MQAPQPPQQWSNDVSIVLGPTNTGKTHLALERMLAYPTGMIGLPLRLLAREVYDRLIAGHFGKVNAADLALITGEEKIIPPKPRYYICTVEAMPVSKPVDFLAVDEVQLATDLERGHIFTDRILHARGTQETMLLGAETMRPILSLLLPRARFDTRSRFSALRWGGHKKLSRLPRRSAIAAFSAQNVYAIAEMIRQQKGGAAVVMGALSPRTRNAQVALYQSGEVDFLVATDAIGMGLNMDIDHVVFAQTRKFDGRQHRALSAAELAQIAGRAGRHTSDGSFGVTGEAEAFDEEIIARIENHDFEPVKHMIWRNADLDFTSIDSLIISLEAPTPMAGLSKGPVADDHAALTFLRRLPDVMDLLNARADVERLWDVAQIPDFRKTMTGEHATLIGDIFAFLSRGNGQIDPDWIASRIAQCDNIEGDLDTLATRIAHIRTWNYVAHKNSWLADPRHWQDQSREVEDKLSDALHAKLTQQFVDRKSAALLRRLQGREEVTATLDENDDITIEGEYAGRLDGLVVQRDPRLTGAATGAARRAVEHLVAQEIRNRAHLIHAAEDKSFALDHGGVILWQGIALGHVSFAVDNPSPEGLFNPSVVLRADETLNGPARQMVDTRLQKWVRDLLRQKLAPLARLFDVDALDGPARGLAFQLLEAGGSLPRHEIAPLLKQLQQSSRAGLRLCGVRFGAFNVFLPDLLRPAAAQHNAMAASLTAGRDPRADLHFLPRPGITSARKTNDIPHRLYRAYGFHPFKSRVIRFDMLERLADLIRGASTASSDTETTSAEAAPNQEAEAINTSSNPAGFQISDAMLSILGCSLADMDAILTELGYEASETEDLRTKIWQRSRKSRPAGKTKRKFGESKAQKKSAPKSKPRARSPQRPVNPDSPFAVLAEIKIGQRRSKK